MEGSAGVASAITAAVAPSPPTAVVAVTPPAASPAARGAWTSRDWLLTSMYQQRLREAAYRCDVNTLWAAAIQHHQQQQQQLLHQQTGHYWLVYFVATN